MWNPWGMPMKAEDRASFILTGIFMVLLLSLVWTGNEQHETKLKVSLVLILPVLLAVGVILVVQRWRRNTLLAYTSGLLVFAVGNLASGYILLGEIDVLPAVVGIAVGSALLLLKRWEEKDEGGNTFPTDVS